MRRRGTEVPAVVVAGNVTATHGKSENIPNSVSLSTPLNIDFIPVLTVYTRAEVQ
jgi:hypothetical protein